MNESFLEGKVFVGGKWVDSVSGKIFKVYNPADGSLVGSVADFSMQQADEVILAANVAIIEWKKKSGKQRSLVLRKWFDLVIENQQELALILTKEQGKPLAEAEAEIRYAASFIEWFAEEAKRVYGDVMQHPLPSHRILTIKQAIGVVAAITPWNFPAAMVTRKLAPALAAGCTVVLKPSQHTPLTALALGELARQAGLNHGELNIVTSSNSSAIGAKLCEDSRIKKISFTGSTEVGKQFMAHSASSLKKLSLELGGNAPFIVFEDADLNKAVQGAITSKYRNAGQTCVCTNRFLVQRKLASSFADLLAKESAALKIGNGLELGVQIGPLINAAAVEKVQALVADAVGKGAQIVLDGKRVDDQALFVQPIVITAANESMQLSKEEIFGPVSVIYTFDIEEEAIQMANNTPFGLAAYVYTSDLNRFWRVSEALDFGMVGINEGLISNEVGPFGGVKESGFGREGSKYGIDEYLVLKYLCLGVGE
jgi:succinate-semialdehyde dehydrogenase/glutarate-semialdehyde dehydrogenase